MSDNPLTPAQRLLRGPALLPHTRWANEPDRLAATKPGRDAAFQKLLDEVDPGRTLAEAERLKRARNAQKAQLERIRLGVLAGQGGCHQSQAPRRHRRPGRHVHPDQRRWGISTSPRVRDQVRIERDVDPLPIPWHLAPISRTNRDRRFDQPGH